MLAYGSLPEGQYPTGGRPPQVAHKTPDSTRGRPVDTTTTSTSGLRHRTGDGPHLPPPTCQLEENEKEHQNPTLNVCWKDID